MNPKIEDLKKISLCKSKSDSSKDFFNSLVYYRTLKRYNECVTIPSLLSVTGLYLTEEQLGKMSPEMLCIVAMCCYAKDYDAVFAAKKVNKTERGKYQFSDGNGYFDFVFQNATYIRIKLLYKYFIYPYPCISFNVITPSLYEKETIILEKVCDSATTVISDFTYDNPLFPPQSSEAVLFIETDADTIESKIITMTVKSIHTMNRIVTPPHYSIYVPSAKGYFVYGGENVDTHFIEEEDILS